VINDWVDNDQIDRTYPLHCYREAIAHVPEDLRAYSNIVDDIMSARQQVVRAQSVPVRQLQAHNSSQSTKKNQTPPATTTQPVTKTAAPDPPLFDQAFNKLGPRNSDSVPLPLLILAGLALLLIAAGAAGLVSRRLRARKIPG
jgi:hypothetical protein